MSWEEFIKSPDTAGVTGAILGWLSAPGGTLREQLFNIVAGFGAAIFVAPFFAERAGLTSQAGQNAFAFVLGLVGMNIIPKLTAAAKRVDVAALLTNLSSLLSKKGKP